MCTVTLLPTANGGFRLTSNRDESPDRHSVKIQNQILYGQRLIYPIDPLTNGTWFCISGSGRCACLLNGAFQPHIPKKEYRLSRGKVVLDSFSFDNTMDFIDRYDFEDIAPFTLILIEANLKFELVWDGNRVFQKELHPDQPYLWSSVTLYPKDVQRKRQASFAQWLATTASFDQQSVLSFHQYGGPQESENGFVMNRHEKVKTLSITSVQKKDKQFEFTYLDLSSQSESTYKIKLDHASSPA